MIAHIDQYFHPSKTVDSLGYNFQLIDIKKGVDKPVTMLKACFSHPFTSLKRGGVNIDPPLQVGFMLPSLLSTYHGMVEDFKLGSHSITTALLKTIVDQCISYDKDPWKGPIGKDGKVFRNPSVNTAGVSVCASSNPYNALANLLFNKHLNHWHYNCKDSSEKHIPGQTPQCKKTASS